MISFQVLTPEGILLQEEVVSILLPAVNGPLLIEGGYTPTIVECLPSGVVKVDFGNKVKYYAEFHGVGRVTPEGTFLFCAELFEDGYEIDMARAIAQVQPEGLSPNKQMVANFVRGGHFFMLSQLYRLKNRI